MRSKHLGKQEVSKVNVSEGGQCLRRGERGKMRVRGVTAERKERQVKQE